MTKKIGKNLQLKKKFNFFGSKTTIYLSLGLHKERPSCRRSVQLSKEAIQNFTTWTLKKFSTFVGHFCPPGSGSGSTDPIESGFNPKPDTDPDPDPQPCPKDDLSCAPLWFSLMFSCASWRLRWSRRGWRPTSCEVITEKLKLGRFF